MTPESRSIRVGAAIAANVPGRNTDLARLAHRSGLTASRLQALVDGELSVDANAIQALAQGLDIPADQLWEFRLATVLESLSADPPHLDRAFREALSPIERHLVGDARFSADAFGPTVWQLLGEHEMTQQELAEGIGFPQSALSRIMNRHDRLSVELIETVAQALAVAPETFVEYRLELIADWLRNHPDRVDHLFNRLNWQPALAEYRAWKPRILEDPLDASPGALLKTILEIVAVEGPVLGARLYSLRLGASGLAETRELRSLLNRACAAASRVGLLLDENEDGDQTQMYRILRLPGQPPVVQRTLGGRDLWHVPPRELEGLVAGIPAWKREASIPAIQETVLRAYGVSGISTRDAEHLNRAIMRLRRGGSS